MKGWVQHLWMISLMIRSWKEHIENKVTEYSEISSLQKDKVLDRGINYAEIKKCSKSLKNERR